MLEGLGLPDGKQVLRYRRGLYTWDQDLPIWTDTDEFDTLCARFSAEPESPAGLEAGRSALAFYGGDFLPGAAGSPWTLSPRTYYHNKYLRLCFDMVTSLRELGRLDEAIDICRAATAMDPYDETCQLLMMQLLQASGARQMALQHYNDVANLLMSQLGIMPSEEMTALYRELSKTKAPEIPEMDLQTIRAELMDQERGAGPLFCEYSAFRDIYRLLIRSVPRSGQVVQLAVITLLDWKGAPLPAGRRTAAMEELHRAILSKLRSGDVFTQLSSMQYLLLLPTASYENGDMALHRVLNAYQRTVLGKSTLAQCSLISALSGDQQKLPAAQKGFAAEVLR